MRLPMIANCLVPCIAQADDLPTNLLLRCQGKVIHLMSGMTPLDDNFDKTLRLKIRTIGDIRYKFLEGEGCRLDGGQIKCGLETVFPPDPIVNSTEKRHTVLTIDRETGEYHYLLETWGLRG